LNEREKGDGVEGGEWRGVKTGVVALRIWPRMAEASPPPALPHITGLEALK